jgi:hypothetical protein
MNCLSWVWSHLWTVDMNSFSAGWRRLLSFESWNDVEGFMTVESWGAFGFSFSTTIMLMDRFLYYCWGRWRRVCGGHHCKISEKAIKWPGIVFGFKGYIPIAQNTGSLICTVTPFVQAGPVSIPL